MNHWTTKQSMKYYESMKNLPKKNLLIHRNVIHKRSGKINMQSNNVHIDIYISLYIEVNF